MTNHKGFTLIELMIVIVIIGILAAIAVPNFFSMRESTRRASCITNQRNIVEGAILYIAENGIVAATINVTVLQAGKYISTTPSECPSSGNAGYDDYTITIANEVITVMRCDIEPAEHFWDSF